MHGSFKTEKMNSEFTRSGGKHHVDNDSNHGDRRKSDPKRVKRTKENHSANRKLKESGLVWA